LDGEPWPTTPTTEAISQAVDPATDVQVRPEVVHGYPAQVLTEHAAGAD
jgi:hypothetical protein